MAKKHDIVGIFGKGHEQSMCFGKREIPWSDQSQVKKALAKRSEK
jgi:UDP-N-acetylmuramoyl-L-alanyl-D-glutamate--2,6-diaminopimelate ligase